MSRNVRIEHDLLGSRDIPHECYYGIHTLRAIENFSISNNTVGDIPELIRSLVMVKKATALANRDLQLIPKQAAAAILMACDEVLKHGKYLDQFPVDVYQGGAGTSVNMNVNEVLANIGLELMGYQKGQYEFLSPNEHVNKCQSTNDAYPTGMRIAMYSAVTRLNDVLDRLAEGFRKKALEFEPVLKMGRTQLQDAVPMTLGQEFMAFYSQIKDSSHFLMQIAQRMLTVHLGGTAIGTKLNTPDEFQPIVVRYLSDVTQLPCVMARDLIAATSDCGDFVLLHSALKTTAVKLSKISNDLRLLSSGPRAGFGEIKLPELQAGSSIMPSKINPVIPEVVNQVCFKVMGNDVAITMAAESGQLQLNVMEPVIVQAMFESIQLLSNASLNLLEKCVCGIVADGAVCEAHVYNSIGIVTYLNPFIGHHNGDAVGKVCADTGKSVHQVVMERGLLSDEELKDILSPENLRQPQYKAKRHDYV